MASFKNSSEVGIAALPRLKKNKRTLTLRSTLAR